jgi:GNAT superfamily N-acetyltransferase
MTFVDHALACRLEMTHAWRGAEYARAQGRLHPERGIAVETVGGGWAIFSGQGSPANACIGLGMDGVVAETDLDFVEGFFLSRGATPRVDVCPLANESLLRLLAARGYGPRRFFSVLSRPLPFLEPAVASAASVPVTRAGPEQAELWMRTTARGFEGADTPSQGMLDILAPNFYAANALCFLAWLDGQAVGGAGMYVHDGAAEFGGDSTLRAYRRRGVQAALLRGRLQAAQGLGLDLVLAMAEPGTASQRNIERAGFHLAYTRVTLMGPRQ